MLAPLGCGHASSDVVVTAVPAPDLAPRAEQEAQQAAPQATRYGEALQGVAYKTDQQTEFQIPIEAQYCYWFGYASEPTVERLSLTLYGPRDRRLESSRRKEHGVIRHCAYEGGVFRLEGKVTSGAGHFAVVIYRMPNGVQVPVAAPPVQTAVGTPPPPPTASPPAPLPPPKTDLAGAVERQALQVAPGARRVGELFASAASTTDWPITLDSGKCYWFIGSGDPGEVKKLTLYLWDPQGRRLTENHSETENVMVGHCATAPGMYKLEAKVSSGAGQYKVGVYAK